MIVRKAKAIATYNGGRHVKRPFGSRLRELARLGKAANTSKLQKRALSLVKTCVQRVTSKTALVTTLQELLSVEAEDPGAVLLAEYVASRCFD